MEFSKRWEREGRVHGGGGEVRAGQWYFISIVATETAGGRRGVYKFRVRYNEGREKIQQEPPRKKTQKTSLPPGGGGRTGRKTSSTIDSNQNQNPSVPISSRPRPDQSRACQIGHIFPSTPERETMPAPRRPFGTGAPWGARSEYACTRPTQCTHRRRGYQPRRISSTHLSTRKGISQTLTH
jgi:hypothetical protein